MKTEQEILLLVEFEAYWTEVRYHEGRASVAEVSAAARLLNRVRRAVAETERQRTIGCVFPWCPELAVEPSGN